MLDWFHSVVKTQFSNSSVIKLTSQQQRTKTNSLNITQEDKDSIRVKCYDLDFILISFES